MDCSHRATWGVVQQDRDTVGDPHHQEAVWPIRDQDVSARGRPGARSAFINQNFGAMNLMQKQGSVGFHDAELAAQPFHVRFSGNQISPFTTSSTRQIEGCLDSCRVSAVPGGECVVDPMLTQLDRLPDDDAISENDPFEWSALASSAPLAGISSNGFHSGRFYHNRMILREFQAALVLSQQACENRPHVT
jgi:hypothetical protein